MIFCFYLFIFRINLPFGDERKVLEGDCYHGLSVNEFVFDILEMFFDDLKSLADILVFDGELLDELSLFFDLGLIG